MVDCFGPRECCFSSYATALYQHSGTYTILSIHGYAKVCTNMFTVVNAILLNTPKTHSSEQMHASVNDVDARNYILFIIYDKVFTEIRNNVKYASDIALKLLFGTRKEAITWPKL